jgi:predicted amidohydrolase
MMGRQKAEFWRPMHNAIRAERARETGMWLVSSDVTGRRDAHRIGLGPTSVISPDAVVVAQVPAHTVGMVTADIG